jgi:NADPH:quinone reductase-like Zn-dependent oxidoreductase
MGWIVRVVVGFKGPRRVVLGREYAGRVRAVGERVTGFAVGDLVMGITDRMNMGAHAEQVAVRSKGLIVHKPDTLAATEAAAFFFGGLTAADFLFDQCALQPGERLLVIGATGSVGSAAVQLAHASGAHVTALTSRSNFDLARSLGANEVYDYLDVPTLNPFDVILDVPCVDPIRLDRLKPGGRLARVTAGLFEILAASIRPGRGQGRRVLAGIIKENHATVHRLMCLHRDGAYRPVVGAMFGLSEIVQAHDLADTGHKRGNTVILMKSLYHDQSATT